MLQPRLAKPKSRYWQVFFLCLLVSAAVFLPHCIIDGLSGGFFHYAGDFNDQQIPFYLYANRFVKQGGSFSWATDLGSGFVNAYSFYLVGSPFFWLSLLVPARWMPWLMVPFLCLKFALAGGGAYLWMRRWPKNENMAMLGACLYAFSGFSFYNVFFNHFLDAVALFPYMLASLDAAVLEDRRGEFTLWVGLNLLNNYFFFAGQAVFLVIYFVCLCACGRYKLKLRLFGRLAFETLLGCAMGCLLLIPAGLSLLQNPRTIDPFSGYGFLVYGKAQQYLAILYSMFLVPDAPYLTDLFNEGITKWTSLSAYLPLFGIAGGLAFCRRKPRHPFTRILQVCLVCAFVPVLNSAFYALNSSFYARWYYMPVLILAAASVMALETRSANFKSPVILVTLFTLSAAAFALVPNKDADGNFLLGVVDSQPRFWAIFGVSMLGIVVFALLLHRYRNPRRQKQLAGAMLAGVAAFSFVYGTFHLSLTKYGQWYHDAEYVQQTYNEAEQLKAALPSDGFYRIDAYDCYNNMGLWLDKSCIQFFNSTVAPHILEFYPKVGVKRDVNSKPDVDLYALRGLLGVRYTLVPTTRQNEWEKENAEGWRLSGTSGSYQIFENENFVPLGLTYRYYVTEETFNSTAESKRGNLLMRALLLSDSQIDEYGSLLEPLPESDDETDSFTYTEYVTDCADRRESGAESFTATDNGFTAEISPDADTLVLFSVPYDDGFTATVNGTPSPILEVDNGLMAVPVSAGENTIEFHYHTPGLQLSAGIATGAVMIYVLYLLLILRRRRTAALCAASMAENDLPEEATSVAPPPAEKAPPATGPEPPAPPAPPAPKTTQKEENI